MRRRANIFVAAALMMALAFPSARGGEPSKEYLVKAAFIYNFMQFVAWPAGTFTSADEPFVVGVVGEDPFNGALERGLSGKSIGTHAVSVRHFANAGEVGACEVLFVPAEEDGELDAIFAKTAGKPVLTIGEDEAFIQSGCIRFFEDQNKIRFEVNLDAISGASLKISAKLEKLAKIFHK